jgi:flagellar biosynthesis protein FlhB
VNKLFNKWAFKAMILKQEGEAIAKEWLSNQSGIANINSLLSISMVAAILFILLANLWPSMQTANTTIQANTATDAGTTTSKTIFGLLLWIIPIGIGIALITRLLKQGK